MTFADIVDRLPAGTTHVHLERVGSTNAHALDHDHDWVTADLQTAGRGRRGRVWTSPPGNLYASALCRDDAVTRDGLLPLRAGLALHDAVVKIAPAAAPRLALKWPNDLLLDGRKVAGLLLEARIQEGHRRLVLGFGVNCARHPDDALTPATDFRSAGLDVPRGALFSALAHALEARLAAIGREETSATVAAWRERAHGIGAPITVRLPTHEIEGRFEDLAADGRLVLARADGRREHIAAGDVFFASTRGNTMTHEATT